MNNYKSIEKIKNIIDKKGRIIIFNVDKKSADITNEIRFLLLDYNVSKKMISKFSQKISEYELEIKKLKESIAKIENNQGCLEIEDLKNIEEQVENLDLEMLREKEKYESDYSQDFSLPREHSEIQESANKALLEMATEELARKMKN